VRPGDTQQLRWDTTELGKPWEVQVAKCKDRLPVGGKKEQQRELLNAIDHHRCTTARDKEL